MSYSPPRYTGNGSNRNFSVTFQYLDPADVEVTVDNILMTLGSDYIWLNTSTIQMNVAPALGAVVEIKRSTNLVSRLVDFHDASVLTEEDLDRSADQTFFILQEVNSQVEKSLRQDSTGIFDAEDRRITNVADPVGEKDAVNLRTVQVTYPGIMTVANSIADVQVVANDLSNTGLYEMDLGSITNPATVNPAGTTSILRTLAENIAAVIWASNNSAIILGAATEGANAAAAASAAATSASDAAASASSAASSASAASTSATNAASSASTALSHKNAAATSATNAATSESNALSSKNAAATSATNAATSATNAASSATSASASATNAATSAGAASTSATNAASSATSASTSATNASTSASLAQDWATKTASEVVAGQGFGAKKYANDAAASATSASTSASNAATSASTATTKASEAATSATNAANSATSASASASTATTKASEASTSATNAASSASTALSYLNDFKGRYYGALASDPTLDPLGAAIGIGDLYFNSTTKEMKVYNGTAWLVAYASSSGGLLAVNNLSDVSNVVTARANLGLTIGTHVQAFDADLTAIAGLAGTSGFLKKTGADTWTLDTATYLTSVSWSIIGSKPTTLSGYGITDAQPLDADLTSIAGLAGTSGILRKTAANTWTLDTASYLTAVPDGSVTDSKLASTLDLGTLA